MEAVVNRTTAQSSAQHMVHEMDDTNRFLVNSPSESLASVASTPVGHQSSTSGFGVESRFPIKQHSVPYGLQPPPPAIVYDGTTAATAVGTWCDPTTIKKFY